MNGFEDFGHLSVAGAVMQRNLFFRPKLRPPRGQHIGNRIEFIIHRQDQGFVINPAQQATLIFMGNHFALIDDRDLVTQLFGFFKVVRGQNDGHTGVVQFFDIGPKLLTQFDVDPGGWFIKNQNRWGMNHSLTDQKAATHPARKRS